MMNSVKSLLSSTWGGVYALREHILLRREYKSKSKEVPFNPLSLNQKEEVHNYWGKGIRIEEKWISFYNSFSHNGFNPRYLPDNLYYSYIDPYFNQITKARVLDDKNIYDLLFHDVLRPETIARKIDGNFLNADFIPVSFDEIKSFCKSTDGVILKPSICSEGGHGIAIWRQGQDFEAFENVLSTSRNYVVQRFISQHKELNSLHSGSINTIRVIALFDNGEVVPLSGLVRMGVNNNFVDNASSGGIFCGLTKDGHLKEVAYNKNGRRFEKHPQGAIFAEHYIPGYDKILSEIRRLAPRLSQISKLTSWDFAVGEDGDPIFIEVNMAYGELDFHQIANGPLFGDRTKEIIDRVFSVRKYRVLQRFL